MSTGSDLMLRRLHFGGRTGAVHRWLMINFINWAASLDDTIELVNKQVICDESNAVAVNMQQGSYVFLSSQYVLKISEHFTQSASYQQIATKEPRMLFIPFIAIVLCVFGS